MGTRFTSSRIPIRAAILASSDGTASPVTVVETTRSTSAGVRPAAFSASTSASAPSSTATRDELVVGLVEVAQPQVAVQRQGQVAVADPGVGVDPFEEREVDPLGAEHLGRRLG